MVTIVEEFDALIKESEAAYRDALAEARKVILEGYKHYNRSSHNWYPHPCTTSVNTVAARHLRPKQSPGMHHQQPLMLGSACHPHHPLVGTATPRVSHTSALCNLCNRRTPRPHAAMPTAEEGASTTPGHVAKRPKGLSAPLVHATATRPKRRPTVQC